MAGVEGIYRTARLLRRIRNKYKTNPKIRVKALEIVSNIPVRTPTPYLEYIQAIYDYLSKNMRYLRDANLVDTIQTPEITLDFMSGDCDDMAVLSASLLESIGYRTQFVITGYDARPFCHVYIYVFTPDGKRYPFDVTVRKFGFERPNIKNIMIEGITKNF